MKKHVLLTIVSLFVLTGLLFAGTATAKQSKILEFDTMVGLPDGYLRGDNNPIRGVPGGGLPWAISGAEGELFPDGKIEVEVYGLVFDPNDPDVPPSIAGTNTVPNFRAIVSCLSKDADGSPTTVNVSTGLFPADQLGNSSIEDYVMLPQPCIAPIVFVTSPGGLWFAASGY